MDLLVSVIDDPSLLLAVYLAANKSHLIAQSIEALQASPKEQFRFLGAVIDLAYETIPVFFTFKNFSFYFNFYSFKKKKKKKTEIKIITNCLVMNKNCGLKSMHR